MLATICGRFRLELAPEMGGVAGVLEKQISSFTLAVDGGLHMHFHHRAQVPAPLNSPVFNLPHFFQLSEVPAASSSFTKAPSQPPCCAFASYAFM